MDANGKCQVCGSDQEFKTIPHQLIPGTVLKNQFLVGRALGQGGFGITYLGRDLTLDIRVAIKEYYPSGYANRNTQVSPELTITDEKNLNYINEGKKKFLDEARKLAKFFGEKGIVNVRTFFEENNTAYIVMEYLEGINLHDYLQKNGKLTPNQTFEMMLPILESLQKIHKQGIIHRDISPENIMLLTDGTLKLMDFGAAKTVDYTEPKSVSIVLKSGYAPEEQYRPKGKLGPWTDIYALCATIYKCITGKTPDDALQRAYNDEIEWPSDLGIGISEIQERVLRTGLAVKADNRFQSVEEMLSMMQKQSTGSEIQGSSIINQDEKTDENKERIENSETHLRNGGQQKRTIDRSDNKSRRGLIIVILVAVIAVAAIAVFTYLKKERSKQPDINTTTAVEESEENISEKTPEKNEMENKTDSEDIVVEAYGHKYQLVESGLEWEDAKKQCESMGGHLVTITSQNEQELINILLETGKRNCYWMGGKRDNDSWIWVTGESFEYTNWADYQPDNSLRASESGEDSLMIYKNSNPRAMSELGQWNDVYHEGICDDSDFWGLDNFGFICEWDTGYGGRTLTYNGHRYQLIEEGYTWEDAQKKCETLGGYLVSITTAEEQRIIEFLLKEGFKNCYWTGGTKSNDSWTWDTGENFDYENWAQYQPDNDMSSSDIGEDTLMIYRKSDYHTPSELGQWNDVLHDGTCGSNDFLGIDHFGFICEWNSTDNGLGVSGLTAEGISSNTVELKWDANSKALGYIIEQNIEGEWNRIARLEGNNTTSYEVNELEPGNNYSFRIMAFDLYDETPVYGVYSQVSSYIE